MAAKSRKIHKLRPRVRIHSWLEAARLATWKLGRTYCVCVCVFGGLTNKPGLRASEEVYCAGSFLSVTVEEPAKRSANDRPARLTRSDKVRPKARHERAGCSSRRAVSWARNTHPISCIPSFIYKACLRSSWTKIESFLVQMFSCVRAIPPFFCSYICCNWGNRPKLTKQRCVCVRNAVKIKSWFAI